MPRMPAPSCHLSAEDEFGPIVNGCGSNFDFTLLFEETILCILPICVAVVLAIARILRLRTHRSIFKSGTILPLKLIAWTLVLGSHASCLAIISIRGGPRTRATVAAGSVGIIGSLILACLSFLEHQRMVRTSSVLVLYLLATIPMDAARARTLWRMLDGRALAIAVTILTATKFYTLVFELLWKCSLANKHELCDAPEESNGIIERALMFRMMPIFWAGYRTPLEIKHLSKLHSKLQKGQLKPINEASKRTDAPINLAREVFRAHVTEFLEPILPRLCFLALTFAQPFLVRRAIDFISSPKDESSNERGAGLIVAYILVYYGIAVVNSLYEQSAVRATTVVRGDLSLRIYQQSLLLDRVADTTDSSTTMMTADIERIQLGVRKLHDAWASFAAVGIALWLIEVELGLSSLVTLALIGGSLILGGYWSGRASRFQKNWMQAIEKRLHKTVQVLKGIKSIKQMGASGAVKDMLENERSSEIRLSKRFRLQLIALVTLSFTSLTMLPALGLGLHNATSNKSSGQILSAQTAFQVMTLFNIASSSIQDCTSHVMGIMVGLGSLQRIESFLKQHTWTDPRKRLHDGSTSSVNKTSGSNSGINEKDDVAVRSQNVSARWAESGDMVIKDATFRVPTNGLTVIAGPTGSGKSTLLRVILGDLAPSSGSVCIRDGQSVAFCDQSPWIANTSIRDNIVGALPFYEERYHTAIQACALDQDLDDLAEGDKHLCGLNGQSVSGGQKARITLARAIYSKADLVLLDDCLVGLDTNTERHILGEIFSPQGLLNSAPVTTILTTSSPRYLPFANHIILIAADGSIVQQGTFAEISPRITQLEHDVLQVSKRTPTERSPRAQDPEALPSSAAINNDIAFSRGANGDWGVYKWYFGAIGWIDFVVFLFLCMLFVLGVIFPQIWLGLWSEKGFAEQRDTLPTFYGIFFGIGSLAWISLASACVYLFLRIAVRTATLFHHLILTTTLNAKMNFFSTTDSGVTLNRFSQDLQITDMELPLAFIGTTMNFLMLIAQCIVVTIQSNWAGFAILAIALLIGFFHEFYLRTSRRLRLMDIEARAPVLSLLLESLDGLATVRAYGWAKWYLQRGIEVLQRSQVPFHFLQSAQVTLNLSVDLFVATLALVVITIAVVLRNTSGGSLGLALFSIVGLGQSVKGVVYFWTSLEITLGAVARIRDFTLETGSEHKLDTNKPDLEWPSNGDIHFDNITLAHSESLPPIIWNLTLDIKAGSKVAICGRTGSGKSTLVNSLLGLVEVSTGHIWVDGVDITTLSKEDVRSRFVVLPQESLVLSVSIRDYASLFDLSNDEDIILGLKEVGLWQNIEQGGGLDMTLTEDAFSHGERQLFAMTLASLRKGKVVLMDEPTSHVDNDIQAQLRQTVFRTFPSSTVLCVTHQVATIVEFDTVVVLDEGKIVEVGDPKKLLGQPTSRFAQLYSSGQL